VQEVLQRVIALVGLRAEQGSLPAIEHEAGESLGLGGLGQLPPLHGLEQHGSSNIGLPVREAGAEAALQQRAGAGDLQA